jgi:hypothetical protein
MRWTHARGVIISVTLVTPLSASVAPTSPPTTPPPRFPQAASFNPQTAPASAQQRETMVSIPVEDITDAEWFRFFETNVMSGIRIEEHDVFAWARPRTAIMLLALLRRNIVHQMIRGPSIGPPPQHREAGVGACANCDAVARTETRRCAGPEATTTKSDKLSAA